MTPPLALVHIGLATAAKTSSTNPLITLLPLLAIGVLGYFFFIRPQQRKAQAARQSKDSGYEVGDEVQTVGGVVGTVLEIHGDRYTLLTGALGDDGNLDGPQPTRIVFVRQAIARKIDRVEDIQVDDEPTDAIHDIAVGKSNNGTASSDSSDEDIDDVGGDSAASSGEHGGEAEEA
jgi:preprotein translocase subunit YajC